jgi:hypothetical protein
MVACAEKSVGCVTSNRKRENFQFHIFPSFYFKPIPNRRSVATKLKRRGPDAPSSESCEAPFTRSTPSASVFRRRRRKESLNNLRFMFNQSLVTSTPTLCKIASVIRFSSSQPRPNCLIDFFVSTDIDEQQGFRAGFRMLLAGKNNPAV